MGKKSTVAILSVDNIIRIRRQRSHNNNNNNNGYRSDDGNDGLVLVTVKTNLSKHSLKQGLYVCNRGIPTMPYIDLKYDILNYGMGGYSYLEVSLTPQPILFRRPSSRTTRKNNTKQ
mmetsp:Transcript_38733/g.43219  ORF Transcript_38733/g.43219 Transcript_38733/m.43219 type:complete len:117 (-) Transcript_38733:182-532(-)